MATIAVFLALGGGAAYAANTVFSRDIANGQVKTPDLANGAATGVKIAPNAVDSVKVASGALTTGDIANDSLKAEDFAAGELPQPQPLTSLESLEGLTCTLDDKPGTTQLTYAANGDARLRCELPPPPPECSVGSDPPTRPNAVVACVGGVVVIERCNTDFWDINGDVSDGCEYGPVPFTGDEQCDGVDNDADGQIDDNVVPPSGAHAFFSCQGGAWVMECEPLWEDANGDVADGCEALIRNP